MKKLMIGAAAASAVALMAATAFAGDGGKGGRWDQLDANGDGEISAEEMSAKNADMLEAADTDGNGAISKEEMRAFHKAKREEMRAKRNPDKNGDGVVDRTEFMNAAEERFEKMDKNGDGVISEDEHRRRGHRGGGHHRRGGGEE